MLTSVKNIIRVGVLLTATYAGAQTKAPVTATKPLETVSKSAHSSEIAGKSEQDQTESKPNKQRGNSAQGDSTAARVTLPGAVEKKPDTAGGLRTAPDESEPRPAAAIRRDPFRPLTLNLRATTRRRENLTPLEQFEISQLKLVGIIRNAKQTIALVEDSVGRGYTVRVGTPIGSNDGIVRMITPAAVLIDEEYIDLYGAKKRREVSMTLPAERLE